MLDRIDIEILRLLQKDGRLSNKQIAAETGLAQSSVHERLKRLRDRRVILGTHAEVDGHALGVGLEALFMVEFTKHERQVVDHFMDTVTDIPEVRAAFLVTGRFDLLVHVVVRDTQHLKDLALDQFTTRSGVSRIETSIIFESRRRHELPNYG